MARSLLSLMLLLLFGMWSANSTPVSAQPAAGTAPSAYEPIRYIAETGHTIQPPITQAYDAGGGARIIGLPLTEVFTDTDGLRVQYFERARFELHPAADGTLQVSRTLLGSLLTQWRTQQPFALVTHQRSNIVDRRFFAETAHTLNGAFRLFWQQNGGLETFGYPISEQFVELEAGQDVPRTVQYFERARFVYHPEASEEAQIQLSPLGRYYADAQEVSAALRAPVPAPLKLGEGSFAFNPSSATGQNIRLALERLDGATIAPGSVLAFNAEIGAVSARTGYAQASMIVAGAVTDGVGGGICMVSSALYVAALQAGLAIEARQGHSLLLRFAEQAPGMEAAVAQPGIDLALRNDTPYPLVVAAYHQNNTLVVSLWGQSDGRVVTVSAPALATLHTLPDEWVFDPTLAPGAIQRVSQGNAGMEVRITRTVRAADGPLLSKSTTLTRYAAWPAVYHYGPDVIPPNATATVAPATATPTMPAEIVPEATATATPLLEAVPADFTH